MTVENPFTGTCIDLAQPRLGSEVVFATDDFFADKSRLIKPEAPVFIDGKYDHHGKWMDGWESRRKRGNGHDYCIIRLGQAGVVAGFEIDTRFFTGNYAPAASVDGWLGEGEPDESDSWASLLPSTVLRGDRQHFFEIADERPWNYLRLNIFPDGGVARLRVYGRIHKDWQAAAADEIIDLGAMTNGARPLACNDQHYGHMENLTAPGRGVNMGDGWETRRRRQPGFDWVIIGLAHPGAIQRVEIDTAHFKGNFPESASLDGVSLPGADDAAIVARSLYWKPLLERQPLSMDANHVFAGELLSAGTVSHVRLNIHPDGGVSRLRLFGIIDRGHG